MTPEATASRRTAAATASHRSARPHRPRAATGASRRAIEMSRSSAPVDSGSGSTSRARRAAASPYSATSRPHSWQDSPCSAICWCIRRRPSSSNPSRASAAMSSSSSSWDRSAGLIRLPLAAAPGAGASPGGSGSSPSPAGDRAPRRSWIGSFLRNTSSPGPVAVQMGCPRGRP